MLVWNPSLELGVRVLDTHHRRLVDMANEVFTFIKAGAPQADVLKKLRKLADFASAAFRIRGEPDGENRVSGRPLAAHPLNRGWDPMLDNQI